MRHRSTETAAGICRQHPFNSSSVPNPCPRTRKHGTASTSCLEVLPPKCLPPRQLHSILHLARWKEKRAGGGSTQHAVDANCRGRTRGRRACRGHRPASRQERYASKRARAERRRCMSPTARHVALLLGLLPIQLLQPLLQQYIPAAPTHEPRCSCCAPLRRSDTAPQHPPCPARNSASCAALASCCCVGRLPITRRRVGGRAHLFPEAFSVIST